MALKTRTTGFTRILLLLIFVAAVFFGSRYVLENTAWGMDIHNTVIEQVE